MRLRGIKRTLFFYALGVHCREIAFLILVIKVDVVVGIHIFHSMLECDHGIALAASGTVDISKLADGF